MNREVPGTGLGRAYREWLNTAMWLVQMGTPHYGVINPAWEKAKVPPTVPFIGRISVR